jgi:hypothetical protein
VSSSTSSLRKIRSCFRSPFTSVYLEHTSAVLSRFFGQVGLGSQEVASAGNIKGRKAQQRSLKTHRYNLDLSLLPYAQPITNVSG